MIHLDMKMEFFCLATHKNIVVIIADMKKHELSIQLPKHWQTSTLFIINSEYSDPRRLTSKTKISLVST